MKILITNIIGIACFLAACQQVDNTPVDKGSVELLQFMKDSAKVFSSIIDMKISGEIKKDDISIKYYSVSEDEFISAFERNSKQIKYFSRKLKVNEGVDNEDSKRIGSLLCFGKDTNNIFLFDLSENKFHSARNFFFDSKIGNYYVIKRIQFEDAETLILNAETNEVELYIPYINVYTHPKDSILFLSDSWRVTLQDEFNISIIKLSMDGIDTLLHSNTNWFSRFSFFDNTSHSIYYIHSIYKGNKIVSVYAKMDISPLFEKRL